MWLAVCNRARRAAIAARRGSSGEGSGFGSDTFAFPPIPRHQEKIHLTHLDSSDLAFGLALGLALGLGLALA